MDYAIKQLFHIDVTKERVFDAISTIEGLSNWWTVEAQGNTNLGGTIQFDFGTFKGPAIKVVTMEPPNKLVWQCVGSDHGWKGHYFTFELDENENKTRIQFTHSGWQDQDEFYAQCSFSWGRYMESLRQYCQTARGEAFGSEGYR